MEIFYVKVCVWCGNAVRELSFPLLDALKNVCLFIKIDSVFVEALL